MLHLPTRLASLTIALALAALPLSACGNAASTDGGASEPAPAASQDAPIDVSSWTTLRDALSVADTNDLSYGYDGNYFVCVFNSGTSTIRAVGKCQPGIDGAFADLDMGADDYLEKVTEIVGDFELVEAADITDELMSQEDVEQYVGKTGQELVDAGFVFSYYNMYGGEQTGADMDNGYYSYSFTFDTQVSEEQAETDSEGSLILDAVVVEAQSLGNLSNAALDPTAVK